MDIRLFSELLLLSPPTRLFRLVPATAGVLITVEESALLSLLLWETSSVTDETRGAAIDIRCLVVRPVVVPMDIRRFLTAMGPRVVRLDVMIQLLKGD